MKVQREQTWLRQALGLSEEQAPFPWQNRLLARFASGKINRALDLPTGLGKTSVMAIWLVASALGASLPRRLIYVVDRRAVVDQATEVALGLRRWVANTPEVAVALGLVSGELPISTLRGQFVDNREWLDDPSGRAIIVGTIDMIGSRLLFEGYGVSRKMRPYQAGLLGCDSLLVLDEAHLVPPFERLLESVANDRESYGPSGARAASLPGLRLLSLSATGRDHGEDTFRLGEQDLQHPVVTKRITAEKQLRLAETVTAKALPDALAEAAWVLAESKSSPVRCIVFAHRRSDIEKVQAKLLALAKQARGKKNAVTTELFVGGRRVRERALAANKLKMLGFLAASDTVLEDHSFLLATSAGEVGVDLDAEHMVADLVAWERMVQRLGRVNRRGERAASVVVIPSDDDVTDFDPTSVATLLNKLPAASQGALDASPSGIETVARAVDLQSELAKARTRSPLWPALTRPIVESWAMTSLNEHTGRPEVDPWLRGWVEQQPQTTIVWRGWLGRLAAHGDTQAIGEYLEAAPPHVSEQLEAPTARVVDWLTTRAELLLTERDGVVRGPRRTIAAVVVDRAGQMQFGTTLEDLLLKGNAKRKRQLLRDLSGVTLVVDALIAGLSAEGLLDEREDEPPCVADRGDIWMEEGEDGPRVIRFRAQARPRDAAPSADQDWRERLRVPLSQSEDGEVLEWLVIDRWRQDAATEDDRSTTRRAQTLTDHQAMAEQRARALVERLGLPANLGQVVALAARLHDEGKRAQRWQRAFSAQREQGGDSVAMAKTRGPVNVKMLEGYRHEFGSLPYAEADEELLTLPAELRDLALHLIAAHHGFGRPLISIGGCDDAPPSALRARARVVALRYVTLQEQWGPWGLAYLEALVRAADQQASRENDEGRGI